MFLVYITIMLLSFYLIVGLLLPFLDYVSNKKKLFNRLTIAYFIIFLVIGLVNWKILLGSIFLVFIKINLAFHKDPVGFLLTFCLLVFLYMYLYKLKKSMVRNTK
ncbi:hypothetical protein DWB88_13850 (plasmid) [Staphylococcus warneri]|nr:hypothetical protein DWB88_13850 [Staphylococcus warneri]